MFQIEPILWLQSRGSPELTALCRWLSEAGTMPVYLVAAVAIAFGVDLRRGLFLLQVMVWNGLAVVALKTWFALPRPYFVDPSVRHLVEGGHPPVPVHGGGGRGFVAPPSAASIEALRALPHPTTRLLGFPSGHASLAVAFWCGLGGLFRRRSLYAVGAAAAVVMGGARLYLGAHFAADVLGGAALGLAVASLAPLAAGAPGARLAEALVRLGPLACAAALALPPLALLPLLGTAGGSTVGRVLAAQAFLALLLRRGVPVDGGSTAQRFARVALALALLAATRTALHGLLDAVAGDDSVAGGVAGGGVPLFLCLALTLEAAQRLGWYGAPGAAVHEAPAGSGVSRSDPAPGVVLGGGDVGR